MAAAAPPGRGRARVDDADALYAIFAKGVPSPLSVLYREALRGKPLKSESITASEGMMLELWKLSSMPSQAAAVKALSRLGSEREGDWHLAGELSDWATKIAKRIRAMLHDIKKTVACAAARGGKGPAWAKVYIEQAVKGGLAESDHEVVAEVQDVGKAETAKDGGQAELPRTSSRRRGAKDAEQPEEAEAGDLALSAGYGGTPRRKPLKDGVPKDKDKSDKKNSDNKKSKDKKSKDETKDKTEDDRLYHWDSDLKAGIKLKLNVN